MPHVSPPPPRRRTASSLRPALFSSKEGAPQTRLKVGLISDETGHNFTFTAPQAVAVVERERFKTELSNIVALNRRGPDASVPPPITPIAAPPTPSASTPGPRPPLTPLARSSVSRATSVASDARTPGTPVVDPTNDFQLRIRVLLSDPELAQLHRELVLSRQITENEFWEGREVSTIVLRVANFCQNAYSTYFKHKPRKNDNERASPANLLTLGRKPSMAKSRFSSLPS